MSEMQAHDWMKPPQRTWLLYSVSFIPKNCGRLRGGDWAIARDPSIYEGPIPKSVKKVSYVNNTQYAVKDTSPIGTDNGALCDHSLKLPCLRKSS